MCTEAMAQSIRGTKSENRQKTTLPPKRGQIKVKIMSKLVKLVVETASRLGKVLSGKKVSTGEEIVLPQP